MYPHLKYVYHSDEDDLLNEFYIPVLSCSDAYDRAVGYFSSTMLAYALEGLDRFVENNGLMRLVIGEEVTDEEYEIISSSGLDSEFEYCLEAKWEKILEDAETNKIGQKLNILCWMVKSGRLKIKYAIRRKGMFHEKIGIMKNKNEKIIFHGSANETTYALKSGYNIENISVYRSGDEEIFKKYGMPYLRKFEKIWTNNIKNTITVDIPSSHYDVLRRNYKPEYNTERLNQVISESESAYNIVEERLGLRPKIPEKIGGFPYQPHAHQLASLNAWKDSNYSGIMALATGAGKTITAIHGFVSILNATNEKLALVVVVPYKVIGEQWCDVLKLFNIMAIKCYNTKSQWKEQAEREVSDFNLLLENKNYIALVVVENTLVKSDFQNLLKKINNKRIYLVGDECHHHSSEKIINSLPDAAFKLGLSATPWSKNESLKKQALESYYGEVVSRFTIDEAIENNVLTSYRYILHQCHLTEDEYAVYEDLSASIGKLIAIRENGGVIDSNKLLMLQMKRSRVLGSAHEKLTVLESILVNEKINPYTLFYCGDGSIDDEDSDYGVKDINRFSKLLYRYGVNVSKFTAEESSSQRAKILNSFKNQSIDGLVAIRVLDEGFDVPACRTAFLLASSRNERQFIQRRGRILRRHEGKEISDIFDFIVLPPVGTKDSVAKNLVYKEMERVTEFIRICSNKNEAKIKAQDICDEYYVDYDEIEKSNLEQEL
ncbi:DEAD/DEAH box helicase [Leucothrix sargassi]|nr:DEAD/DEAH box helicase [Leucothrix sargassi]